MPLTHTLCPDGEVLTFDECLACDHECFDLEVRETLFERERNWQAAEHTGDHITATSLLGCLRSTYLERITDYAANPESQWYSLRGELIHRLVERPDMDNPYLRRSEMRLFTELDGMRISGQIDNYKLRFLEQGVLTDWKSIGDNGLQYIVYDGAKEEHIWQTNIYAWLLRRNGYSVRKIEIAYLSLMQIVKTGTLTTFNEYLANAPTKAGKRKHMTGIPQLIKEYVTKKKWRCSYRVPDVPLFDDPHRRGIHPPTPCHPAPGL